jgi:hypothetical protein
MKVIEWLRWLTSHLQLGVGAKVASPEDQVAMASSPPPNHFLTPATTRLGPLLERLGYRAVGVRYDEAAFGSALAEYSDERSRIRIIWDGRDSALSAELRPASASRWVDVESGLQGRPASLDPGRDDDRIERLARAIEIVARRQGLTTGWS